jgi:DnaJ-class molecular chaperone
VQVQPHDAFTREGDDLREKVPIDIYTLMLGGEAHIPTLDRPLMLTIPADTPNGKTFRLRGQGMPNLRNPEQRGDLYATIDAQLPQELSEQEQDLVRQLRALRDSESTRE